MKNLKLVVLSALLISCLIVSLQAQASDIPQVAGGFVGEGWNTNEPSWNLSTLSSGIYSLTTTIANPAAYEYKLNWDHAAASWNREDPTGQNAWSLITVANQPVTFYYDSGVDPTWSPDSANMWNTANISTTGYTAQGFLTWLGSANDTNFNFAGAVMHSAGNGIYTTIVVFPTIIPATTGSKGFWVEANSLNGSISGNQIGAGLEYGGNAGFINSIADNNQIPNQLPVSAFYQNDTVTFWADTIRGRLKVTHTNPGLPGPPWYATGDYAPYVSGGIYTYGNANTQMNTSGNGIYTKSFPITYSSVTHFINVVDGAGNRHPVTDASQGTYFSATAGQTIVATYDASTHLDGWLPFTNFVYTSNTTDRGAHQYNVVGTFTNFGFTDWDLTNANLIMNDTTSYSGGNPNIYTWIGVATNTANLQWKIALDQGWDLQIGTDGASLKGNPPNNSLQIYTGDTVLLKADVYYGRFIAENLTHNVLPSPSVGPNSGKPSSMGVLTASGGTAPYIAWTSSNTGVLAITGFAGNTASVNYGTIGSSTVTVYDSLGQTGWAVINTTPTSAPLAPDSAFSNESRNTILWDFKE